MAAATEAFTSAGSKIFISNTLPVTHDQAGYEALTFTEIGQVTDIPEFGPEYTIITHLPLSTGVAEKKKGSRNNGAVALNAAMVRGDAGHQKVLIGLNDYGNQAFMVEYQDGTVEYFDALVASYKRAIGNADQITACTINVEVNTDIVTVEAP